MDSVSYSHIDNVSHAKPGIKPFPARLYVVTAISNPVRYVKRYQLYRAFEKQMAYSGAVLFTAECAFGGREYEITDSSNPRHLQLRTSDELWHKENMLNLMIQRLPADWQYVAWIDADVTFVRPEWAQETLQALQHYDVVQPWSECMDLGPDGQLILQNGHATLPSMMKQFVEGKGWNKDDTVYYSKNGGHSGYAWAARRSAIDTLGGLMDYSILGANDHHMARALMGTVATSFHHDITDSFKAEMYRWQERALELKHNIGYVPGTVMHHWHGSKKHRRYNDRWKILVDNKFDPVTDIYKDRQGLWQLRGNKPQLRDDIRAYLKQRNEDSIDV